MNRLFLGTSGYVYKDWKGIFYPLELPQKDWLEYYSTNYNTVEINATFYRSFPSSVFASWKNRTPDNFTFSIKGPRLITHIHRLSNIQNLLSEFLESSFALENKLVVIIWQFPASFANSPQNMQLLSQFVSQLSRYKRARYAFEFRHTSWFVSDLFNLLNSSQAGFVTNDTTAFPGMDCVTSDFAYIRFHGPGSLYSSKYSDQELMVWAGKIKNYLDKYDVYCYFNNDYFGYAIQNAHLLNRLILSNR